MLSNTLMLSRYFILASFLICAPAQAKPQDVTKSEFQSICAQAGGEFRENSSGYSCCWSNWGCYACINGECSMHCNTQRCKDANNPHLGPPKPTRPTAPGMDNAPVEAAPPATGQPRPSPKAPARDHRRE